ncbi:ubiquitin domain-containing protein 1 [Hordeum vulgare]|nr:ubiquitin domain-containing protein 1 [Hordeum vulgare]
MRRSSLLNLDDTPVFEAFLLEYEVVMQSGLQQHDPLDLPVSTNGSEVTLIADYPRIPPPSGRGKKKSSSRKGHPRATVATPTPTSRRSTRRTAVNTEFAEPVPNNGRSSKRGASTRATSTAPPAKSRVYRSVAKRPGSGPVYRSSEARAASPKALQSTTASPPRSRILMGCVGSTPKGAGAAGGEATKKVRKPKPWKHPQPITIAQLRQMRDEFWDTAPHYGGRKEIWDALRAASEADVALAQAIVESAGVIVSNADLTLCYDERGAKYELPKYVLSEPTNLVQDS